MTLQELKTAAQEADISDCDWAYRLVQKLPDYERGYLDGKMSQWNEVHDFSTEGFREVFLEQVNNMLP